jgi:hypothetical protein
MINAVLPTAHQQPLNGPHNLLPTSPTDMLNIYLHSLQPSLTAINIMQHITYHQHSCFLVFLTHTHISSAFHEAELCTAEPLYSSEAVHFKKNHTLRKRSWRISPSQILFFKSYCDFSKINPRFRVILPFLCPHLVKTLPAKRNLTVARI